MKIYKSAHFDQFRCIASQCPDSCCHEWSVTVDEATAAYYRALPGQLGDRLRQVLAQEDGETVMTIVDGRCPMWRDDGLCRIQAVLGHDALCKTCREFPRITHDYGDFRQYQLELSCPEAARLILSSPALPSAVIEQETDDEGDYDEEAMSILLSSMDHVRKILASDRPMGARLAIVLMYGYHIQAQLDGGDESPFDPEAALEEAAGFAGEGNAASILDFYKSLEILTERWQKRLDAPLGGPWAARTDALAWYFVERYWLQAVSDYDLISRVKFAVISCLVIRILGGDFVKTAQLYSKEIENDPENLDALLDGAYSAQAFTDAQLLGLLLNDSSLPKETPT